MKFTYASGAQPVQRYTIRRGLGRGGFGEVNLAVSEGGKEVALKLVQHHLDVELRGVGNCLNLKHPHLVDVYDILSADNDETWVVMEYIAGESLDRTLAGHPQGLSEPQAVVWLHGMAADVLVTEGTGPVGLTAAELIPAIRVALNRMVQHHGKL